MRNSYDLIVIGGGLSGMIAAAVAAENGKKTAILTKGAGTLTIGGGVIDVYGYTQDKKPVVDPIGEFDSLPEGHPYRAVGKDNLQAALDYFIKITEEYGYPYGAVDGKNCRLPTAVGTTKPTYLIPKASDPRTISDASDIKVVGVEGLKDFYPELVIEGLTQRQNYKNKTFTAVTIPCPTDLRDLSALDMARYVDSEGGLKWLTVNLHKYCGKSSVVILPPVLGTKPSVRVIEHLQDKLDIHCFETPVMPPSVPGLRIRHMLMDKLKKHGVSMIELAEVVRADVEGDVCKAIYSVAPDKERRYCAPKFIVATGGFFGGGCVAEPGKAYEAIFRIDLHAPGNQEDWSEKKLLGSTHPFASMGVTVNDRLQAVDRGGNPILTNVHFTGRTVGGYDFVEEKSGNGVAIATGHKAGRI